MTQTQNQNQTKETDKYENVYFLVIDDNGPEEQLIREHLRQKYPGTKAKVVTELKLQRLTDRHLVVPCFRRPPNMHPGFTMPKDGMGMRVANPSQEPVSEGKPVVVKDYWNAELEDGDLDANGFVNAVAKSSLPAVVKYRSDSKTLRLAYA